MLGLGLHKGGYIKPFIPSDISGLNLWFDATDESTLNSKMAADFIAANSESLSSASSAFDKGDEDFSFGAWVWMDVNTGGAAYTFMGKYNATGNQRSYGLSKQGSTNSIIFPISSDGINTTVLNSGVNLTINTWNFVVGVYDSVNDLVKISVNNANFVTAAHSGGAYAAATTDFYLGQYGTGGNYLDGRMDGAFFYDKALTQAQVDVLYNSGNGILYADLSADSLTSLVSWWELNELSGTRVDSVGANDLTDNNTVGYALGKIQEPITNNGNVWRWLDKSSNSISFTQDTASAQSKYITTGFGTNSKPYIDFIAASQGYLNSTTISKLPSHSVFIACYVGVTGTDTLIADHDGSGAASGGIRIDFAATGQVSQSYGISGGVSTLTRTTSPFGTSNNNYYIFAMTYQSGDDNKLFYYNGVQKLLDTIVSQTATSIGGTKYNMGVGRLGQGSQYLLGRIAEIVVYDNVLSSDQRATVNNYLNNKYGIF